MRPQNRLLTKLAVVLIIIVVAVVDCSGSGAYDRNLIVAPPPPPPHSARVVAVAAAAPIEHQRYTSSSLARFPPGPHYRIGDPYGTIRVQSMRSGAMRSGSGSLLALALGCAICALIVGGKQTLFDAFHK